MDAPLEVLPAREASVLKSRAFGIVAAWLLVLAAAGDNPPAIAGAPDRGMERVPQAHPQVRPAGTESARPGASAAPAAPASTQAEQRAPVSAPAASPLRVLIVAALGMVLVVGLIVGLKLNAFLALLAAALAVSLLSAGEPAVRVERVARAFGDGAAKIGIVIALAAVIGKCMLDSGAADRIVRTLMRLFGARLSVVALAASGFLLAIPVFFDTVFYLLVPLARSLHRRTGRHYMLYLLAIGGGAAITHTLVPPTPGPTAMAAKLSFSLGTMILIGVLVAAPSALVALAAAVALDRWRPVPMRTLAGMKETEPPPEEALPPFWLALLPVALPVVLIGSDSIFMRFVDPQAAGPAAGALLTLVHVLGNPNLALFLSAAIALATLCYHAKVDRKDAAERVEVALMSGGVIILITAARSAFGTMLKMAGVGNVIETWFAGGARGETTGLGVLFLGFGVAAVLKIAQGSSTVAMVTGSSMLAGVASGLPFHPVYLACAIGAGSLLGSWMNDSGFWVFAKMGGLTEWETLRGWTVLLAVLSLVSLGVTCLLSQWWPQPLGGGM